MIRWAIGYDHSESGAFYTLAHSIHRAASMPVSVSPVSLRNLQGILTRDRDPLQSNDFSFSRFLVPWMMGYEGWAIFSDCDMLVRDDPAKLWALRDDRYAVMCVHHNHQPKETEKYLGNQQTVYPRKNWSSLMLMNCARLQMLTPEYVNSAAGLELHQFRYLEDAEIGTLPAEWNHLVGYDAHDPEAKLAHWTSGGPYFRGYEGVEFADEYWAMRDDAAHISDPALRLELTAISGTDREYA